MNNELIFLLSNFITAAIVLYYPFEGWNKGGLYMLIMVVKLIGSFFITQCISNYLTNIFFLNPDFRNNLISFILNNENRISQLPGASLLFFGRSLENTIESQAWWLVYILIFIIVFIILMIVFSYLLKLAFNFNKIPILGLFNRLVGIFFGLIFGLINTLILIYLIAFILGLFNQTIIEQALITSWLPVLFRNLF